MTTKFVPASKAIDALLVGGEEMALEHQNTRLQEAGQVIITLPHSKEAFHFRCGFEYGVQWALDNAEWLAKYKDHSYQGEVGISQ